MAGHAGTGSRLGGGSPRLRPPRCAVPFAPEERHLGHGLRRGHAQGGRYGPPAGGQEVRAVARKKLPNPRRRAIRPLCYGLSGSGTPLILSPRGGSEPDHRRCRGQRFGRADSRLLVGNACAVEDRRARTTVAAEVSAGVPLVVLDNRSAIAVPNPRHTPKRSPRPQAGSEERDNRTGRTSVPRGTDFTNDGMRTWKRSFSRSSVALRCCD